MPISWDAPNAATPTPARRGGIVWNDATEGVNPSPSDAPESTGDSPWGPAVTAAGVIGGLGLTGAAIAAHNPTAAKAGLGKVLEGVKLARLTSMLSGFAPLKSMLGNLGAAENIAMEQKTLAPLKALFSKETARDFASEWKNPSQHSGLGPTGQNMGKWNPFGRVMQAGDVATSKALVRSGTVNATEAQKQLLQAPLPADLAKAMDSPAADVLIPFRRNPYNQWKEGWETIKDAGQGKNLAPMAAHSAIGFAAGDESADSNMPLAPGLAIAHAARYGLPTALAAVAGRHYGGGKGSASIVASALPAAEFGILQSATNPLAPLNPSEWGAVKALRRMTGGQ